VRRHAFASSGLSLYRTLSGKFSRVISELEIWRAANLLLKRYGDKAGAEGTARADALAAAGDRDGEAVWRRITHAVAPALYGVAAASRDGRQRGPLSPVSRVGLNPTQARDNFRLSSGQRILLRLRAYDRSDLSESA